MSKLLTSKQIEDEEKPREIKPNQLLFACTGTIGEKFPENEILSNTKNLVDKIKYNQNKLIWIKAALGIMTTDTKPKLSMAECKIAGSDVKNIDLKNTRSEEPINQIKNIKQEDEKIEKKNTIEINNLEDLIEICLKKKEMKLKYELENNVNLVSFSNMNIEISINDKLNKNFIKDLSEKLYDWTKNRWLISFSKEKGGMSEKEKKHNLKKKNIIDYKSSSEYKNLLKVLPDIELTDIEKKDD